MWTRWTYRLCTIQRWLETDRYNIVDQCSTCSDFSQQFRTNEFLDHRNVLSLSTSTFMWPSGQVYNVVALWLSGQFKFNKETSTVNVAPLFKFYFGLMIWFRTKEIVVLKKIYKKRILSVTGLNVNAPLDVSCRRLVYDRHSISELRTKIVYVRCDS